MSPQGRAERLSSRAELQADPIDAPRTRGRLRHRVSPLTRRILAVNVLALGLLGLGLLYLGDYRQSLIDAQLDALATQGEISAAAISEGAVFEGPGEPPIIVPDLGRPMLRHLVEPTHARARLFNPNGVMIGDSRWIEGPNDSVIVEELPPPPEAKGLFARAGTTVANWLRDLLPASTDYPPYIDYVAPTAEDLPEVEAALRGEHARVIRRDRRTGDLYLSVAVPIQRYREVLGAVVFTADGRDIEHAIARVRLTIVKVFLSVLALTVLLSIYLASTIARPIRRLALAAERVRHALGRQVEIPDLTDRRDEIGELSAALREMTRALQRRIDAIEHFAADVAHEIKNPLTSLKSAVETVTRVTDPEKQRRLLAVVVEDVARLDRLITDISNASRLDAEMGRMVVEPVSIADMLRALADLNEATRKDGAPAVELALPPGTPKNGLVVDGIESRLGQVFSNLIANAISFSPPSGSIRIRAERAGRQIVVLVEDDGPGIPDGKLEAIFDRFYTERPAGEKFGTHSGLGLSISKQIVEAHQGSIHAENRRDTDGRVTGARFVVRLPAA